MRKPATRWRGAFHLPTELENWNTYIAARCTRIHITLQYQLPSPPTRLWGNRGYQGSFWSFLFVRQWVADECSDSKLQASPQHILKPMPASCRR
ncbi:hypothetical protein CLAIMM_09361 [Cladophialophora immunda]|nr:hypothetical protein CLAIMM_09361 [Cladophialophora immunda]